MNSILQDLRYGARMLVRHRGFTTAAVLSLALGIGANTAIFSIVYNVLLRPLPFDEQERLVMLWKRDTASGTPFVELALAEVRDWQERSRSFTSLAAMPATVYGYGYLLSGRGEAVQLESAKVTGNFFATLGARALYGRVFDENDDRVNGPKVAILSNRLWRERFNSDPQIIGQMITLTEQGFTVVGVMPEEFEFPKGADLWVPIRATMPARISESRGASFLEAVGRLAPGVTLEQAEAEMNGIIARIASEHPETESAGHRVVITPLAGHLFGDARPALWLLLSATGMLLLIATANIANLMLVRAAGRGREMAVRAALGAGRLRLIRLMLAESTLLVLAGGLAGMMLSHWIARLLVRIAPADIPRIEDVTLNAPVLFFSLLVTLLTAILCGLLPALAASRSDIGRALVEGGGKLSGGRAGMRARGALVVAEVAVAVVLLAGALLILRTFVNISRVDLGFDPKNVVTMHLRLQGAKYGQPEARREFYRQLIERLEARPGIQSASAVLIRPLEGTAGWDTPFILEGQSELDARRNRVPNFEAVTPHYFRTFRIPIKAGREFDEHDTSDAPPVAIISETMAKTLFGAGADALGKRLRLDSSSAPWMTIVGIAGDARYRELEDVRFDLYIPFAQWPPAFVNHFAVRATGKETEALAMVRSEVASLDASQAVTRVATMEELLGASLARRRFSAMLLNSLSGLALLAAALGIYSVLSYSVAERRKEFGIRLALGAQKRDILQLVIGQGIRPVAIGLAIGLTASFALTRLIERLLFGVSATDPATLIGIALLLAATAIVACLLPARRAMRIDPWVTLRHE